jgi:sulfane dehydrogenase subunit SoxC
LPRALTPVEWSAASAGESDGQLAARLRPERRSDSPAQGYPLRLINPGWEGNTNVKWLHSLKLTNQAYMARDETAKYTELMPDGKAWMFTYEMDAKSVITFPSGGQVLPRRGPYELTGLAWSGRGRIERVEVTLDGGEAG